MVILLNHEIRCITEMNEQLNSHFKPSNYIYMNGFDINNIAEVKLIYLSKVKASDRPKIKCSKDAYDLLLST
ncbi:MAG TPA: hypothetical protein VMV77_10375 [Bacteroidales bacterium]|nr:hypothetical protein [Bacteroidales bacterium]